MSDVQIPIGEVKLEGELIIPPGARGLGLNEQAFAQLRCKKELEIVPGATHLFEEPGALESVGQMAADWFGEHLQSHPEATG